MMGIHERFGCPSRIRAVLVVLAPFLLAGCSGKEVPDSWISIIESEAAMPPAPPSECATAGDPNWVDLPARDINRDEAARNLRANKDRFRELAQRRRVCAAGLVATAQGEGS